MTEHLAIRHTALKLKTGPTAEPLTLAKAKAHLRVLGGDEDAVIRDFLKAAREEVENQTDRALMPQTWDLFLDEFPAESGPIVLHRSPVQSITTLAYIDTDGNPQTLTLTTDFVLDASSEPARIVPAVDKTWPSTESIVNAVTVTFLTGYANAAAVPHGLKAAIRLILGHLFNNRESVVMGGGPAVLPMGAESLISQFKVRWLV